MIEIDPDRLPFQAQMQAEGKTCHTCAHWREGEGLFDGMCHAPGEHPVVSAANWSCQFFRPRSEA